MAVQTDPGVREVLEASDEFRQLGERWLTEACKQRYMYGFAWLGRPIIQLPQDIVAMQELIWQVRPDVIVETGIAHGGSLILSASMLALLDYCDAVQAGQTLDPSTPSRRVIGVDIDIREHNRRAMEAHPLIGRIEMIEGSSIEPAIVERVKAGVAGARRVLVALDSNHTHDHALAELRAYAPLTTRGSYCVVFDTIIEDLPAETYTDRPWGPGDNPKTAVHEFLKTTDRFEIDRSIQDKLQLTVAPDGFLRRVTA